MFSQVYSQLIYLIKFIFTNRTSVDVKPGLISSKKTWFDINCLGEQKKFTQAWYYKGIEYKEVTFNTQILTKQALKTCYKYKKSHKRHAWTYTKSTTYFATFPRVTIVKKNQLGDCRPNFRRISVEIKAWWQAQTSKRTSDRLRQVTVFLVHTRGGDSQSSEMHFPNRNDSNSADDSNQIGYSQGRCFNYVHTCRKNPRLLETPRFLRWLDRKKWTFSLAFLKCQQKFLNPWLPFSKLRPRIVSSWSFEEGGLLTPATREWAFGLKREHFQPQNFAFDRH